MTKPIGSSFLRTVQIQIISAMRSVESRRQVAICVLGCICVVVVSGLFLRLATGEALTIVRLVSYFAPWILIGMTFVSIAAIALNALKISVVSLLVCLLIASSYVTYYAPKEVPANLADQTILVMSYNTLGRNDDVGKIADVIRTEAPDLVLLQEVLEQDDIVSELSQIYGNHRPYVARDASRGLLVVSRYQLRKMSSELGAQRLIVETPCGDINLWNLRGPKALTSIDAQYTFVAGLMDRFKAESGPILAAGDFNFTESSVPYAVLRTTLMSAQEEAGFGFGPTFPAEGRTIGRLLPPLIRIDHVFFSRPLVATNAWVLSQSGGSDHYPVMTALDWTTAECAQ